MANNNLQNIRFLRNGSLYADHATALSNLTSQQLAAEQDGSIILARYGSGNEVKTLVGVVYFNGSNKSLTIFDIDGASADVQELREEINAKLGAGITSANTATAQLAALSGNSSTDTSATTSVEGAKKYADALKEGMDYTGVTTGEGVYVTNVTETDGIVSATTATLPSVTGEVESKKVVMSVSEDKGEIAVTKGTIESSDKTVVIGDLTEGNGIDFKVNIDGETLIADTSTGVISVASAALTQYVGDEDTIHISAVDSATNTKTISSPLTISATTPTEANVKEQYNLVGASGNTIGATIKIYKDSSLYNVYLGHMDDTIAGDPPVVTSGTGDTALCFIYHKEDGSYELVPVNVESFLEESEFESGVTATNHIVHGVVDSTSEKDSQSTPVDFLTVGADGFKISGIKDEIDRKLNAIVDGLDADKSGSTEHITVNVVEENGIITTVTVEEDNIANADDLAELSGKTVTALTSTNGSITAQIDDAAGCKTYNIQTDADKIQMSGFSADNASALSGIAESDSIATAFEKTNTVITENERVTASALTDLDTRVDTISGDVDTIKEQYVSGVSVNNKAVTVTNHVASISISPVAGTGAANTPIVINTDDSTGAVTIQLQGLDCGTY